MDNKFKDLAGAIIKQAFLDIGHYQKKIARLEIKAEKEPARAHKARQKIQACKREINSCQSFFDSDWFLDLAEFVGVDAQIIKKEAEKCLTCH